MEQAGVTDLSVVGVTVSQLAKDKGFSLARKEC
jgi:hypothetical protein